MTSRIEIRNSVEDDVDFVYELAEPFVATRQLLRRSREEIKELIPQGFTAVELGDSELDVDQTGKDDSGGGLAADTTSGIIVGQRIVGFAAVEIYSRKLAEILCLAVSSTCQGRGVGKQLVQKCVEFAKENDVHELMAISSSDYFLKNCGFDYTLPDQKRALFIHPRQ